MKVRLNHLGTLIDLPRGWRKLKKNEKTQKGDKVWNINTESFRPQEAGWSIENLYCVIRRIDETIYEVRDALDCPVTADITAAKAVRKAKAWAEDYLDHRPQLVFLPFTLFKTETKAVKEFGL